MAKIEVVCGDCGRKYSVEERHKGRKFPCKECGVELVIDDPTSEAIPVAKLEEPDPPRPPPSKGRKKSPSGRRSSGGGEGCPRCGHPRADRYSISIVTLLFLALWGLIPAIIGMLVPGWFKVVKCKRCGKVYRKR